MSSNPNQGNKPNTNSGTPLNEKVLAQFIDAQILKAKNESKELEIKSKQVDHQARYADKWLAHQAEIIKDRPNQQRKNVRSLTKNICMIIAVIFVFIGYCLWLNKDTFVIELIKAAGYVLTTAGGYYFGRRSGKKETAGKDSDNSTEPYQEVD